MSHANGKTLEQTAYEVLKQAIYERKLAPGASLTERDICNAFGVGRTPARAAIQRLADDGFVNLVPNRGAFVVTGSRTLLLQYFEVRTCLLVYSVQKCFCLFNQQEFKKMEELVQAERTAFEQLDFKKYLHYIDEFFSMLVLKTKNPFMFEMYKSVNSRISILMVLYDNFYMPSRDQVLSVKTHQRIIDALKNKEPEKVEKLLTENYKEIVRNICFEHTASASIGNIVNNE